MTTREPQPWPAPAGVASRRSFLKRLGTGAGAVAVLATNPRRR
jgi:hypothetical protein